MIGHTITHYKILSKLGEGGMGVVYKADDTKLDRIVALKFLPSHVTANDTDKARFIQEAKAAAALNHPNVCVIHDIQEHEGQQFILMEYVEGRTLRDKIKDERLTIKETVDYASQIAEALKAAHSKDIIHRDIKSENIMVTSAGQIKVMDFGLAKLRGSVKLTKTSTTAGTLSYSSPEQIQGKEVDARSDIFSFGVVLYEMLTGQLPFKGDYESALIYSILDEEPEPVQKFVPGISSELVHIINRLLEKDPENRYQSMKEVLIDLKRVKRDAASLQKQGIESRDQFNIENKKVQLTQKLIIPVILICILLLSVFVVIKPFQKKLPPCLRPDARLVQLTSDVGMELGRISPDGKYIQYVSSGPKLYIKDITTGTIQQLSIPPQYSYSWEAGWSPDGNTLAVSVTEKENKNKILIYSILGKIINEFELQSYPLFLSWSPDRSQIAYYEDTLRSIGVIDITNRETNRFDVQSDFPFCYAWSDDSKKIAFIDNQDEYGLIRILDVSSGTISQPLEGAKTIWSNWIHGGLAWSPDGNYLVYAGLTDDQEQLFALPVDKNKSYSTGQPFCITNLRNSEQPLWPCFTSSGKQMSFIIKNDNFDVYLLSFDQGNRTLGKKITAIATNKRMDLARGWTQDGRKIIINSYLDGQPDLYLYDLELKEMIRLTKTIEDERWPEAIPHTDAISYYSKGTIWRLRPGGGSAIQITPDNLKLNGRHAWSQDGRHLYVVCEDTMCKDKVWNKFRVIQFDPVTSADTTIFRGAGPFSDLLLSPDGIHLTVTDVVTNNTEYCDAYILNFKTGQKKRLCSKSSGYPPSRGSCTKDSQFLLFDDVKIGDSYNFGLVPVQGGDPIELKMVASDIGGYICIEGVSPSGDQVLVNMLFEDSDIWMLEGE